jgi:ABC-type nickel/cobalt efflux system permease component RcnA
MNDFLDSIPLFFEVYVLIILVVGMAWIWRKLKDIETHLKERALVQEKHNEHVSSELSAISHDAMNQEWEKKLMGEQEMNEKDEP